MAPRGRKAFGLACAAASSTNGSRSRSSSSRNLHSCLIPSSSPHSSPLPEKRNVPEYRLASIRSTVFISNQNIIAHNFSPFAARTSIFSYNHPLFLSSPSSLLLQSTTPFYCPGDVSLESRLRIDAFVPHDTRLRPTKHSCILLDRRREGGEDTVTSGLGSSVHRRNVNVKKDVSVQQLDFLSNNEVFNWPNAISFGRLLSGPFIAWLVIEGFPQPALVGLAIAGASDWLDGYVARRTGVDSIVGTYLDPLADKVLIGCVALSMAHAGYLPLELVILVVVRDAILIGGSFMQRSHSMNWQLSSLRDFFNVSDGVPKVKPLYISKINTVFQLALVGTALFQPAFGIEDTFSLVPLLSWCVAFTTCASTIGYGWKLFGRKQFINM